MLSEALFYYSEEKDNVTKFYRRIRRFNFNTKKVI